MPQIDLDNENYAAEVLSYYLWGQKNAPSPSEMRSSRWIDRSESVTLSIDPQQFISKYGDLFSPKDFKLLEVFFSGRDRVGNDLDLSLVKGSITRTENGVYELTHNQFVDLFYNVDKLKAAGYEDKDANKLHNEAGEAEVSVSLYKRSLGVLDGEYARRALVFGTVYERLDTENVRYYLDENLKPLYVKNFDLVVYDRDFDLEGGDGSEFGNSVLKVVADPSRIGRKVGLDFNGGAKKSIDILTKYSYEALEDLDGSANYAKYALEWEKIVNTGVVNYRDEDGKLVLFGTHGSDILQDAKIRLADLANSIGSKDLTIDLTIVGSLLTAYKAWADRGVTYVAGKGSDTVYAGDGDDTIYTNANIPDQYDQETSSTINRVYAGDGEDHIYGSKGTDIIYADSDSSNPDEYHESDFVEGKGGSDVIYGGGDDDILYADSATSHTDASGDYIVGGLGADKIYGSDGDDTIYGDKDSNLDDGSIFKDNDTIYGYGGNDTLYGGVDEDTIDGGIGDDTLKGGEGEDILLGGAGMDQLDGGIDDDTLLGGDDASTDILLGGSGEDTILGQGGDDVLAGGSSWSDLYSEKESDYLLGGSGFDTYYVSNSDTINDADYSGLIMFNDKSLGGKKRKVEGSDNLYEDDYFVYALNGDDMVVNNIDFKRREVA